MVSLFTGFAISAILYLLVIVGSIMAGEDFKDMLDKHTIFSFGLIGAIFSVIIYVIRL